MPGVYISYPFCNQKCTFCNFASGVATSGAARAGYEEALLTEIRNHRWAWEPETIYLGGGTPSLMDPDYLATLLGFVSQNGFVSQKGFVSQNRVQECTLECAPGTLTPDRVTAWARAGINRVSLGVQSFEPIELKQTGRRHSTEIVTGDVALLRAAGISNINLDLIAGLPHQTANSWQRSLDQVERLAPPHLSVYLFEVDGDSRLGNEILSQGERYGAGSVPADELTAEFYEIAVDRLARLGYRQYEISNFALSGAESAHNLKYWNLEPYIGFGLDAHSFNGASRWSNPDELVSYLNQQRGGNEPARQMVDRGEERFFVGLRLLDGILPTAAERVRFAEPIQRWTERGYLLSEQDRLRLAPQAVLISNEIFQDFLNVEQR